MQVNHLHPYVDKKCMFVFNPQEFEVTLTLLEKTKINCAKSRKSLKSSCMGKLASNITISPRSMHCLMKHTLEHWDVHAAVGVTSTEKIMLIFIGRFKTNTYTLKEMIPCMVPDELHVIGPSGNLNIYMNPPPKEKKTH